MKKIVLFVFIASLGLSACKKDYACNCSSGTESYTYEIKDVKPKDADQACQQAGDVWISSGGSCAASEL
ncbi:MAG: hypothetical protein WEC59_06525 [Salibacteraceae bacterium]